MSVPGSSKKHAPHPMVYSSGGTTNREAVDVCAETVGWKDPTSNSVFSLRGSKVIQGRPLCGAVSGKKKVAPYVSFSPVSFKEKFLKHHMSDCDKCPTSRWFFFWMQDSAFPSLPRSKLEQRWICVRRQSSNNAYVQNHPSHSYMSPRGAVKLNLREGSAWILRKTLHAE